MTVLPPETVAGGGPAVPHLGSEAASLRWQIEREDRRRRRNLLALVATPAVALVSWAVAGIPAYLVAPYPVDSDDHAAFVSAAMLLGALLCTLAFVGFCLYRHALAARRGEKHRVQLFRLGGTVGGEEPPPSSPAGAPSPRPRRAFLVHGHDDAALHEVARFLERLGLETVVLRELPSGGKTVIEKFMAEAEVDCAVVLLTPDDRGGLAGEPFDRQRMRARQNVLLELGFFLGRLGRGRVCVLYKPGVEIPSDYAGVLFVELDPKGAWKLPLAGELREAGVPVDLDLVLVRVTAS